jgi:hypothetical protein
MRAACVQHARDRQVEIDVVVRQTGERCRCDRHAMIGALAADDLLLVRAAERVVHVPDELHLAVVCFRTGIAEEHFRDRDRRDLLQLFGKLDCRVVALRREQMREGQFAHLGGRGLN